ncbi:MAG: RNA polymerase sigma factor [Sphingomonadaceae bacterium]
MTQPTVVGDADAELVRRMASGDESALRSLYALHARRLFAHACRVTGDRATAEEVLQDSLLAAWRGAHAFRGESRVITWLLGIVHRQALNATRRKRLPTSDLGQAAETAACPALLDEHVAAADRRRALTASIARLSPEHRAVLELVFYQGLSLAEVARVCGCPIGTVKSRLSYAKVHLRSALERAGQRAEDLL